MDLSEIKRRAQAAREFGVQCGVRGYTLRMPTRHEKALAYAKHAASGVNSVATWLALERALLEACVVGWSGLTEGDLLGEAGNTDLVVWSAEAVPVALDALPDDAAQLAEALTARITERQQQADTAAKN